MNRTWKPWSAVALLASLSLACGTSPSGIVEDDETARRREALNACNESVPADRVVDGIPAYAQCDAVSSGDIWSNNGVDTSATSGGDGWFRTQRGGGYQCTELARRYLYFAWGIDYQHGNAQEWCDGELPPTLALATTPVHGDLIVFEGGVCGASTGTGHIALIDEVDVEQARVTFIEQNRAGRRSSDIDCGKCFLHVVANGDASGGGAGAGGSGGVAGSAGTGGAGEGPDSGGAAGVGGEPVAGGAGGSAGSATEPPFGNAGASNGGHAGSGVSVGVGGNSAGASGSGAGGASAGAAAAGSGGVGGAQAGASASAGSSPGSGGGVAGESADVIGDEPGGLSCSAAPARQRTSGAAWLSVMLAGVALSLQRRGRAIRPRR